MRRNSMVRSRLRILAAVPLLVGACGPIVADSDSIVEPTRIEIATASGHTLDCPDELVASSIAELGLAEEGSATPRDAADLYLPFLWQEGVLHPVAESTTSFVLLDDDGHRLAWIDTVSNANGWFVIGTEECGSSFGDPAS